MPLENILSHILTQAMILTGLLRGEVAITPKILTEIFTF